jgi:large subunit ribosomal protein L28
MRCELCGKEPTFGRTVSRLSRAAMKRRIKGRSSRKFNPNIQAKRVVINGTSRRMKLCTSCLKRGSMPANS